MKRKAMLGKKEEDDFDHPGDLNTIIGKGTDFDGTLNVQSSIRVDGKIKGRISTTDSLIVGKEGVIDGEVTVKNAIIGGKVKGKVHASGKVVLEAQSYLHGELKTAKLVIDEGASFEGVCSMGKSEGKDAFGSNAKSLIGAPQKSELAQKKK